MVDQAEVTTADGRTELPPRAVARGTAEFLHDVTTLAELQGKLVIVDLREGVSKLVIHAVLLIVGGVIGLGCVPIALAAVALTIDALTELSLFVSFWIALALGLVLTLALALPAYARLKTGTTMFERSYYEWGRNVKWVKDTLNRIGKTNSSAHRSPGARW